MSTNKAATRQLQGNEMDIQCKIVKIPKGHYRKERKNLITCNYAQVLFIVQQASILTFLTTRLLKNNTNNLVLTSRFRSLFKCVGNISVGIHETLKIHRFLLQLISCIIYL